MAQPTFLQEEEWVLDLKNRKELKMNYNRPCN